MNHTYLHTCKKWKLHDSHEPYLRHFFILYQSPCAWQLLELHSTGSTYLLVLARLSVQRKQALPATARSCISEHRSHNTITTSYILVCSKLEISAKLKQLKSYLLATHTIISIHCKLSANSQCMVCTPSLIAFE